MKECSVLFAVAFRDFTKFLRDKPRILASFIFPILFIGVLGIGLDANLGKSVGYSFLTFVFTGVFAQTLFQSSAAGVISLVEDRENDFSKEIFIAPISRYTIILGKILGEAMVSMAQGIGIILFGLLLKIPLSAFQIVMLIPVGFIACLVGGAFGIFVLSNLGTQRRANQIFPFIIFPQIFLAGVFNPIKELPLLLLILSRLAPLTYIVDLVRGVYYAHVPEASQILLASPVVNLTIVGVLFLIFLLFGTVLFINKERNL